MWSLVDAEGSVIREESFENAKARPEAAEAAGDGWCEGSNASSVLSRDDHSTIPDDVDAAIDLAGEISDSDVERAMASAEDGGDEDVTTHAYDTTFHSTTDFAPFDPDEDDAFSDGYQEVKADDLESEKMDWAVEKEGHLALLKRMFGGTELGDRMQVQQLRPDSETDSDTHDEVQDLSTTEKIADTRTAAAGVARRAALLGKLLESGKTVATQFTPIPRFDPGQAVELQEDAEAQEEEGEQQAQPRINKMPSAAEPRSADRVEMTTLTDMFRPKELKGGFSLMADLELDLDDDLNFEPDIDVDDEGKAHDAEFATLSRQSATELAGKEAKHFKEQPAKQLSFLPRYNAQGRLDKDGNDAFASILREINDASKTHHDQSTYEGKKAAALTQFFVPDNEETLAEKWKERKATLTQEYKRRHREALKKKKRKYVGSRNAGNRGSRPTMAL
jgi:hypothetical protein